jgi:regulator of replication initiation timing
MTVSCPSFPIGVSLPADYPADWFATGLGAELERTHPVLPFAIRVAEQVPDALVALASRAPMVAVRDTGSRDRLRAAGVDRDIEVVAHPGLLLDRVVDLDSLPARADQLRQLGVLPEGQYDVTDDFLPDDLVFEDRLAVLAAARTVTTSDEHVAAACAGLGVPCAGDHPSVSSLSTLTTQLDRLAELAEQTLEARGGDLERRTATLVEENHALRAAHWRLRQRLLTERQRLAEPLAQAWQERDAATTEAAALLDRNVELARRNEELTARLAHVEQELSNWRNTKLVRWTRPLRDVYGKARG